MIDYQQLWQIYKKQFLEEELRRLKNLSKDLDEMTHMEEDNMQAVVNVRIETYEAALRMLNFCEKNADEVVQKYGHTE